ncbi:hypothetical protein HD554DRAFT_41626 [Boletus coccyginus]|nr:hypothetical protein HD554DRAFT_41626 [Boletus coccyginus]
MSSGTEWPSATVQYRLDLPHALHSVSPSLSALHASRAVALHPETSTVLHHSHCPKCGTYRFSGDHPSYLADPPTRRKRRRASSSHSIALQRRCRLCGFSIDARTSPSLDYSSLPVQLPSAPTIARTKEAGQEQPPSSRPTAGTVGTAKCAPIPPLPGRQPHPKPSHMKTSTLKDMLSRDRQKEEIMKSRKKGKEGHEGLAAFLKEL